MLHLMGFNMDKLQGQTVKALAEPNILPLKKERELGLRYSSLNKALFFFCNDKDNLAIKSHSLSGAMVRYTNSREI